MRKVFASLLLSGLMALPAVGLAATSQFQGPGESLPQLLSTGEDLQQLIDTIGNWIFVGLLAIAAIFLLISGYNFIFSQGSQEKVTTARTMLVNALIGVAIGLGAKGLVAVIGNILGYK